MQQVPSIFSPKHVMLYRDRAAKHFSQHSFLFEEVMDNIAERLQDSVRAFPLALDLGCRTGGLRAALTEHCRVGAVVQADISARMLEKAQGVRLRINGELLPFATGVFDLIVSAFGLHTVNDLPGVLIQARKALKPDGIFIAAVFGGETLKELRQVLMETEMEVGKGVAPHIFPFMDIKDAAMLMQRVGYMMPVADSYRVTVSYSDIMALMHDIRGMGESNALVARQGCGLSRAVLARAASRYHSLFPSEDRRITATFEVVTLTGMGRADIS